MLFQCPCNMLPHQFRGMLLPALQGCDDFVRGGSITQTDRNIPQPAFMADAMDSAALRAAFEVIMLPAEQPHQLAGIEPVTGLKIGFAARTGKTVPGRVSGDESRAIRQRSTRCRRRQGGGAELSSLSFVILSLSVFAPQRSGQDQTNVVLSV